MNEINGVHVSKLTATTPSEVTEVKQEEIEKELFTSENEELEDATNDEMVLSSKAKKDDSDKENFDIEEAHVYAEGEAELQKKLNPNIDNK